MTRSILSSGVMIASTKMSPRAANRLDFVATTIFLIQTVVLLGSLLHHVPVSASIDCSDGTIACLDGSACYSDSDRCDKVPDCPDFSDERNCTISCSEDEFYCVADDECFPNSYKCDGGSDCSDDSDEVECGNVTCSLDSEFMCLADKKCIVGTLRCDGMPHCHDNSDEMDCDSEEPEPSQCDPDQSFDCTGDGTHCIQLQKRCDSHEDCPNGEDETDALCSSNSSDSRCSIQNGGCSHTCFGTEHGFHCSCPEGFQLMFDHKTCEDIDECDGHACSHDCNNLEGSYECLCYEGYRLAEDFHACLADGEEPELWATNGSNLVQYSLHSGDRKITNLGGMPHSVVYDRKNEKIFWIDSQNKAIYWSNKDAAGPAEVLIDTLIEVPAALAYDWVHQNLYWADAGPHTRHTKIEVVTLGGEHRWRTVVVSPPEVDKPKFMVVDPRKDQGYLYWAQGTAVPVIRRAGLDGSEPETIVSTDLGNVHGLTLDLVQERLLWVDSRLNIIASLGLHDLGREVLKTFVEYPKHPIGIGVFEDFVYWADIEAKSIQKLDVFRPATTTTILEHLTNPHSIEIYHKLKQPEDESYCGNNNGGCSHICLPSPQYAQSDCVCPMSTDKTKHYVVDPDNSSSCQLVDGAFFSPTTARPNTTSLTLGESTRPQMNSINPKSFIFSTPSAGGGLNTPPSADSSTLGQSGSDGESDNMWVYIGVAGAVGLLLILVLSIVGYKLYARHVSKNLHFDNPVFEQKPLRNSERQADSRA